MSEPTSGATDTEEKQLTNREWRNQWQVDVNVDPRDIPLPDLNPGHDAYHQANKALPLVDHLRAEAPLHLTENSQFGPSRISPSLQTASTSTGAMAAYASAVVQ